MIKTNKRSKLPQIPNKRYFTIGEVGFLCSVKPHVLRYWEQEFPQLKPSKRRGNRRYYQRDDVLMIREIRGLLYDEGYTISGARIQLDHILKQQRAEQRAGQNQRVVSDYTHDDNHDSHAYKTYDDANNGSQAVSAKQKRNNHDTSDLKYSVSFKVGEHFDSDNQDTETVTQNHSNSQSAHNYAQTQKYKQVIQEVIAELEDMIS